MTEWPARICQPEPGPGYPGETPHDASVQVAGAGSRRVPVAQRSSLRQSALARAGTSARRTQTPRTAGVLCPDAGLAAGPGPARLADDSPTDTMSPSGLARTAGRVEVLSGGPATSSGGCLKSVPVRAQCQGQPGRIGSLAPSVRAALDATGACCRVQNRLEAASSETGNEMTSPRPSRAAPATLRARAASTNRHIAHRRPCDRAPALRSASSPVAALVAITGPKSA